MFDVSPAGTWTLEGHKRSLPICFLVVVLIVLIVLVLRLVAVIVVVVADPDSSLSPRNPVFYAPPASSLHRDVRVTVGQSVSVDEPLPLHHQRSTESDNSHGLLLEPSFNQRQKQQRDLRYLGDEHPGGHGETGSRGEVTCDHDSHTGLGEGQLVGVGTEQLVHHQHRWFPVVVGCRTHTNAFRSTAFLLYMLKRCFSVLLDKTG